MFQVLNYPMYVEINSGELKGLKGWVKTAHIEPSKVVYNVTTEDNGQVLKYRPEELKPS